MIALTLADVMDGSRFDALRRAMSPQGMVKARAWAKALEDKATPGDDDEDGD